MNEIRQRKKSSSVKHEHSSEYEEINFNMKISLVSFGNLNLLNRSDFIKVSKCSHKSAWIFFSLDKKYSK